ncbi:MAG: hypothetical protein ABI779_18970 [Acidobacteriota bacterium]
MPPFSVNLDVLRDALFERSLSQVGQSLLRTSVTAPLKFSGLTLTPGSAFDVRVFNRADDKDGDAVIGGEQAHVPFVLPQAWLKYTLTAEAEGKLGLAPAAFASSREVTLSDYRLHDAADGAWNALRADLAAPRVLLELDDVRMLAPGEALRMEMDGTLSASLTFDWSDVLFAKLAEIAGGAPVAVKLKSGLEARAGIKVSDQFSVVISRTKDGHFRFAVNKAASRSHAYGMEASLDLSVSAIPAVDEVLDSIFAELDAQIDPQERAAKIAAGALDDLRGELRRKLVAAATWKAATGFAYEYARIDEQDAIADFVLLDDTRLEKDHALVLAGDFGKVADVLRQNDGAYSLVRYLNESTLTRRSSFGFSLGIGKWIDVAAKDSSVFRQTTRTSLDGFQLVVSRGTRKYEEKGIPQNDFEWVVDLKAEMKSFTQTPSTLDFDYGLHLLAILRRESLDHSDLARMLDFAAMWGVSLPPPARLAEALGRKGEIRVQLLFERDALESALSEEAPLSSWAEPLAMAMPYMSVFAERRSFATRAAAYRPAWQAWLEGTESALSFDSGLTVFESQGGPGSFRWIAGQGHPQLRTRLDAFVRGMRLLHDAMTTAQAPSALGTAYDALQQFWTQRLYVTAVGRWLLSRTPAASRSLQIDLGDLTITA